MTINADRKIISLTGPNCSFANINACRVDVVSGDGIAPFFTDGFESGDFMHTENGVAWGTNTAVTAQTGRGNPGFSAQFQFSGTAPGGDATAEQRFDLGAQYPELTIIFDLYIPDGAESWGGAAYAHRDESPNNNKLFRLWFDDYNTNEMKVGASLWRSTATGTSISSTRNEWGRTTTYNVGEKGAARQDIITTADLGTWMEIKLYCKIAGAGTNGTLRIYKNGTLLVDNTETVDNYFAGPQPAGWQRGYLLGYANSGFDSTTRLQVDNVRFYAGAV